LSKKLEIIGNVYGRLTVISFHHTAKNRVRYFMVRCSCGNEAIVSISRLRNRETQSCGCIVIEILKNRSTTHGMSSSKEFISWRDARARCNCPTGRDYLDYGGRGIRVCPEWDNSFDHFYIDMGPCPQGMTLERQDVNGNYDPRNCIWTSKVVQSRNKRTSKFRQSDIDQMRNMHAAGLTAKSISEKYNITTSYLGLIIRREAWK
jgi:hypothetical protein